MSNKNRARPISSPSNPSAPIVTGTGVSASDPVPSGFAASSLSVSGLPLLGLHKSALREACDLAGGQKSLAARIGTTQSMVWYWLVRSKRGVPGEFVLAVEAVTGVSRHALRPDIFPESDPETGAPPDGVASHATAEDCP
jgi:DNA-binding transcriptional regulator YdaS (Cro superfamily)